MSLTWPFKSSFSHYCEFYSTFHSWKPHKYGIIKLHGSQFRVNHHYYPHFRTQGHKIHRSSETGHRASHCQRQEPQTVLPSPHADMDRCDMQQPEHVWLCTGVSGGTWNVCLFTLLLPLNSAALQVQAEKYILRNDHVIITDSERQNYCINSFCIWKVR